MSNNNTCDRTDLPLLATGGQQDTEVWVDGKKYSRVGICSHCGAATYRAGEMHGGGALFHSCHSVHSHLGWKLEHSNHWGDRFYRGDEIIWRASGRRPWVRAAIINDRHRDHKAFHTAEEAMQWREGDPADYFGPDARATVRF